MAKNVIITEDGNSKTISNATRIRTALEGGGTCDWIPKDDVPLQELTVTEDGVYDPEEGYYGFSQVTANGVGTVVEGTLIEKSVTKNGTYNITDETGSPYGYSKIVVNVDTSDDDSGGGSGGGGSNPVVGKDEDGNDTMAETDDDGNIVMTALPTEIKVIIPPTKLEYNRYEEIDYSGISVYAYISKAVHWLGTTTTAISEGASNNTVSIGGNSVTASVGDGVLYAPDRTGANDIQLVWDGTKWVKPGNYSAEKAAWKSDKYPTGKIPFEELILPVKRAQGSEEKRTSEIRKSDLIEFNVTSEKHVSYDVEITYKPLNMTPYWVVNTAENRAYFVNASRVHGNITVNGDSKLWLYYTTNNDSFVEASGSYSLHGIGCILPITPGYNYVTATETVYFEMIDFMNDYGYNNYSKQYYTVYKGIQYPGLFAIKYTVQLSATYNGPISNIPYVYDGSDFKHKTINYSADSELIQLTEYGTPPAEVNEASFSWSSPIYHSTSSGTFAKGKSVSYWECSLMSRNLCETLVGGNAFSNISADVSNINVSVQGHINSRKLRYPLGSMWNKSDNGAPFYMETRPGRIAWTMMYGDKDEEFENSITLPVQWKRPGDGKILETTFTAWMKDDGGDNNGGDD